MGSDDVIDLAQGPGRPLPSTLALRGVEGEWRHFALPLWRMARVAGSEWSGLVRVAPRSGPLAITVVDLGAPRARSEPVEGLPSPPAAGRPHIRQGADGTIVVSMGTVGDDDWYVVLAGGSGRSLGPRRRLELLFLAGECAGMLGLTGADPIRTSPSAA